MIVCENECYGFGANQSGELGIKSIETEVLQPTKIRSVSGLGVNISVQGGQFTIFGKLWSERKEEDAVYYVGNGGTTPCEKFVKNGPSLNKRREEELKSS